MIIGCYFHSYFCKDKYVMFLVGLQSMSLPTSNEKTNQQAKANWFIQNLEYFSSSHNHNYHTHNSMCLERIPIDFRTNPSYSPHDHNMVRLLQFPDAISLNTPYTYTVHQRWWVQRPPCSEGISFSLAVFQDPASNMSGSIDNGTSHKDCYRGERGNRGSWAFCFW